MMYRLMLALAALAMIATGVSAPAYAQKASDGAPGAPAVERERKVPPRGANLADRSTAISVESRFEAGDLLGKSVVDPSGKEIAKIAKVLPPKGRAREVVLNLGGVLGFGAKQVIYPANKIELGKDGTLHVALTKKQLNELAEYGEKRSK